MKSTHATAAVSIWLVLACMLLALRWDNLATLRLPGTDDYLRFVQVLDWLDGAGWTDLHQDRMSPPEGVTLHWSRLPDLPIAAVIAATEPVLGRDGAIATAAAAVPLCLLLALALATTWMVRPLVGSAWAPIGCLLIATSPEVIGQFAPGRVDHHGWQLLLAAVALGCLVRLLIRPTFEPMAVLAGLALAAGVAVGPEALPWVAAFHTALGVGWVLDGRRALVRSGTLAAAILTAAALTLLFLLRAPDDWTDRTCDTFSLVGVGAAVGTLAVWAGLGLLANHLHTRLARLSVSAGLTALVGACLVAAFPACAGFGYGAVDPRVASFWLSNVTEAKPILALVHQAPWQAAPFLVPPLVAMGVALWGWLGGPSKHRLSWLGLTVFLLAALALSLWQVRASRFGLLFSVVAFAWLAAHLWRATVPLPLLVRALARCLILLLVSPLLLTVLSNLNAPGNAEQRGNVARACPLEPAIAAMVDEPGQQGADPPVVAAFIDMGPELLFRGPVAILGAPYHRNNLGNRLVIDLFSAPPPDRHPAALARHGVRFILLCDRAPEWLTHARTETSLIAAIAAGQVPPWLDPRPVPDAPGLRLFAVVSAEP